MRSAKAGRGGTRQRDGSGHRIRAVEARPVWRRRERGTLERRFLRRWGGDSERRQHPVVDPEAQVAHAARSAGVKIPPAAVTAGSRLVVGQMCGGEKESEAPGSGRGEW